MAAGYDVVVVGGGIGGLTVAALLSARGVSTCVLERQSQVGGCIGRVEFSGFQFEPGMGVYTSFGQGEIYERIFSELPVDVPQTSLVTQPYVVRLADGTDVKLIGDESFVDELVVDLQLRAGVARARGPLYAIHGGPATLAERLAESIKRSGGTVRLDTPVLRLAYDQSGEAIGVDLLSGERVAARTAIVSNLTIWDTYGKLIGLNRTPSEIKKQLNALHGSGAYVVYATIEEAAIQRLPSGRMLVATTPTDADDDWFTEITLAVHGRTVTLKSATDVNEWFTYHASEVDFEESDQAALERFWTKLHAAVPELGSGIEIIETANPRTFYDQTRRKLGMVMGIQSSKIPSPQTVLPNLFVAGDTVSPFPDLSSVAQTALSVADAIKTKR
ncbi:MAG TPA: FAD-dependent oxidoreductase [Pyrinomonadaceae bacterium]|nr:FAD-dependent oxidoreductase [Pyrinomonadaceae bacterium]